MVQDALKVAPAAKQEAILDGQVIAYTIRQSARARYIRFEVRPDSGLTVVVPRSYRHSHLIELLNKEKRWILGRLANYRRFQRLPPPKSISCGDTVPFLGRELRVIEHLNGYGGASVELAPEGLMVRLKSCDGGLRLALEDWYRQQAEHMIRQKADEFREVLGVSYRHLTIRAAKTRWGSCSQKGNLNFNWRLMMAPEPVVNYVIIHELSHLKQLNHTHKFWALVEEHCPDWRVHKRWLKEHETQLAAILAC